MKKIDLKRWKGKFTSRKGMGMELALLVLLVVFGCSTLLVSSAMIGKSNMTRQEENLAQRTELDQIAEQFCVADKTITWTKNAETGAYDFSCSWTPPEGSEAYFLLWDETLNGWSSPGNWWTSSVENAPAVVDDENVENDAGETPAGPVIPELKGIRLELWQDGVKRLTVSVENGVVTEWTYH